ncbi:MAG: DMT family transporter [Nocardiaceae bacterium]|nr:DMT family transporter [Nocardiaceae bacterium]
MRNHVALILAVVIGIAVAIQSRLNGTLGTRIHDGVAAAIISFGSGLVVLTVFTVVSAARRARMAEVATAVRTGRLRWWHCVGGLAGASAVASQGITVTTIGVALFTISIVAGQVVSGVLVDRAGLGPAGRSPITARRIAGAAIVLAAVAMASHSSITSGTNWLFVVFPVVAGAATAWQMAVNGKVAAVGGPMTSALVNFAVGTTALLVVGAIVVAKRGWPGALPHEPWLYLGGLLGILFIAVSANIVHVLGVLLLALATIAGQLIGALALDLFVPAGRHLNWGVVVGCVLALVGVWVGRRGGAQPKHDQGGTE